MLPAVGRHFRQNARTVGTSQTAKDCPTVRRWPAHMFDFAESPTNLCEAAAAVVPADPVGQNQLVVFVGPAFDRMREGSFVCHTGRTTRENK